MNSSFNSQSKAFTLIEVMIVVAILGIVASIAYPAYTEHIAKAKRADAMAALVLAAEAYERYRTKPPYSYNVAIDQIFAKQVPVDGGRAYYNLTSTQSATSYKITATPTGSMSGKKTLTLSNTGARTWGSQNCWPESGNSC